MRGPRYILTGAGVGFAPPDFGGVVLAGAELDLAGVELVFAGVVVVLSGALTVFGAEVPGLNSLKPPARVSTHTALYCGCEPHEIPAT